MLHGFRDNADLRQQAVILAYYRLHGLDISTAYHASHLLRYRLKLVPNSAGGELGCNLRHTLAGRCRGCAGLYNENGDAGHGHLFACAILKADTTAMQRDV